MMDGSNLHQRVLKLRDVALGSRKSVSVGSPLAAASYEAVADSLLALHAECTRAGLAKDKHAARFLQKCKLELKCEHVRALACSTGLVVIDSVSIYACAYCLGTL